MALNVIEHVRDDEASVVTMASLVGPGGRVVVLVPACEAMYGSIDRELNHYRRYTRSTLARVLTRAGCRVDRVFYFNLVGAFGWWLHSRAWRVACIPAGQLRWFDRLVPLLRAEDRLSCLFGQSVIGFGMVR